VVGIYHSTIDNDGYEGSSANRELSTRSDHNDSPTIQNRGILHLLNRAIFCFINDSQTESCSGSGDALY